MSILDQLQGSNISDPTAQLGDAVLRQTGHDPETLENVGPPIAPEVVSGADMPKPPPVPADERNNVSFMRQVLISASPIGRALDPTARAQTVRVVGGAAKDIIVNTTKTAEQLSQWINNSFQKLTGPSGYQPPENFDTPISDTLNNTLRPWIADAQGKGEKVARELASLIIPGIWAAKLFGKAATAAKLGKTAVKVAERAAGAAGGAASDFFVMDPNSPALAEQFNIMPSWLREPYEKFMSTGQAPEELEKDLDKVLKRKVGHMTEGAIVGELLQTGIQGLSRLWHHLRNSDDLIKELKQISTTQRQLDEQAAALREAAPAEDILGEAAQEAVDGSNLRLAQEPNVVVQPSGKRLGRQPLDVQLQQTELGLPPEQMRLINEGATTPQPTQLLDNGPEQLRFGTEQMQQPNLFQTKDDFVIELAEEGAVIPPTGIAGDNVGFFRPSKATATTTADDFLATPISKLEMEAPSAPLTMESEPLTVIKEQLRPPTPATIPFEQGGKSVLGTLPDLPAETLERLQALRPQDGATLGNTYPDAQSLISRLNSVTDEASAMAFVKEAQDSGTFGGKMIGEMSEGGRTNVNAMLRDPAFPEVAKVLSTINRNPNGATFIGAGVEKVALDIGDGLVAKLSPHARELVPDLPGFNPPVGRFTIGGTDVEITRFLPTSDNVTREVAQQLGDQGAAEVAQRFGISLEDVKPENFRVFDNGTVVFIDTGFAEVATQGGRKVAMGSAQGTEALRKRGIEMLGIAGAVGLAGAAFGGSEAEASTGGQVAKDAGNVLSPLRKFLGPLMKRGAEATGELTSVVRTAKASRQRFVQQGKLLFENLKNGIDVDAALENLAKREDIAKTVKNTAKLTDPQLADLADKLGFNQRGLLAYANNNRPLTRQAFAGMEALKQSDTRMRELAEAVKGGNVEAESQLARQFTMHVEVQRSMLGLSSELGRALRQLQRDPNGNLKFLADLQDRVLNKKIGTNLSVGDLAEMILDTDAKQLNHIARESMHPTAGGAMMELWKGHRLMSLKTVTNNIVGSAFASLWDIPVAFSAGAVNQAFSMGGEQRMADAVTLARGMFGGLVDAFAIGAESFRKGPGSSVFGNVRFDHAPLRQLTAEAVNLSAESPIGAAVNWYGKNVVGGVFNAMEASDDFMKAVNFRGGLHLEAVRAVRRGEATSIEEFLTNPPAEAVDAALKRGEINTFSRDLFADNTHPFLRDGTKKLSQFAHAHPAMQFFFPFVKTQSNLMMYALDNAPGLSLLQRHAREAIKAGGTDSAEVLGRTMSASFMVAMFGLMAAKGNITGLAPQDPESRAIWLADNKENHITLSDGVSIPYDKFEPFSPMLSAAATMAAMTRMEPPANSGFTAEQWQGERMKLALATTLYASKLFTNKTYLRSFKALADAVLMDNKVPGKRQGEGLAEGLAVSASEVLTGFIPALALEVDESIRPERTELLDFVDRIQSRIPFFRPRGERNMLGEKVILGYGFDQNNVSPFVNFANVLRLGEAKSGELAKEAQNLGLNLRMHSPFISLGGSQLRLTEEEYDDYGKFIKEGTGTTFRHDLERLIADPGYKASPAFVREAMWKQTVDFRRAVARGLLLEKYQAALLQRLQEETDRKMRTFQVR